MEQTIVFVMGTSFSGSSLLNSLLDTQPQTRGLGEAVHLFHKPTKAWCSQCQCHVDTCQLQTKIDRSHFYESIFKAYPNTDVIVNSSKHWEQCFHYMPVPPNSFRIRIIVLSKSHEEFAFSYARHRSCSFVEAIEVWIDFYQNFFANLDAVLNHQAATEVQHLLCSRIDENSIAYVTYHDLATNTDRTIKRVCDQLNLPFSNQLRQNLWRGNTCTIGGNNAVYAQRTGNRSFFETELDYLDGKYIGRQDSVFYDDLWSHSDELRRAVDAYRFEHGDEVAILQARLGHRTGATMIEQHNT